MTIQRPASRRGPIVALVALAVLLVTGAGLWYLFLRPAGPAPVSLASASPGQAEERATDVPASSSTADPSGTRAPAGAGPGAEGGGLDGSWSVDASIGSFDDFSGSFVGYRVRETLATIGATEAVGRTPEVTGSVTVDGTSITAAEFSADLTALRSDDDRRDGQLRRQALETEAFPTASFVLTAPIDLGRAPAAGETFEATATGDLTLHGVTRPVEVPVQGRLRDGVVTIAGSLPIVFADYGIAKPESMIVLSVEDDGVMEFQLQLTRA